MQHLNAASQGRSLCRPQKRFADTLVQGIRHDVAERKLITRKQNGAKHTTGLFRNKRHRHGNGKPFLDVVHRLVLKPTFNDCRVTLVVCLAAASNRLPNHLTYGGSVCSVGRAYVHVHARNWIGTTARHIS